jgi:hypothetical protein
MLVLRPRHLLLLSLFGCTATEAGAVGIDEAPSTSAQDIEVARQRAAFSNAPVSGTPLRINSISATGIRQTWRNCTERSAKKNDPTKKTVTYAFAGNGRDLTASGTGFGKAFLPDATEGAGSPREVIGYPANIVTGDTVVLDVARLAADESLLIERIVKPSVDEPLDSSVYERAVYPDSRAFAIAYVSCPATDRVMDGGSRSNVLYYDDCKDDAFTKSRWGSDVCHAYGLRAFPRSPVGLELKWPALATNGMRIDIPFNRGVTVNYFNGQLSIRSSASATSPTASIFNGLTSLRVEFSDTSATVYANGVSTLTVPTIPSEGSNQLMIDAGTLSELTIW